MMDHISPSQINMFYRCPQQYEWRYMRGIKCPPGISLLVGAGVHGGIETNLQNKINTGELLPDEAVAEATRDALVAKWSEEEPVVDEEAAVSTQGEAVDQAVSLGLCHHMNLAPHLAPIHVEREVRVTLPDFNVDVLGYIDIQEAHSVRDTKTMARKPSQADVDTNIQLTYYALAVETIDGTPPETCYIDAICKTKTPKVETLRSERNDGDFQDFMERVEVMLRVVETGIFAPCATGSWMCNAKWCGYWSMCKYGRRKTKTYGGVL